MEYIAAFLLITTGLVPFAFFLGISGDNAVLPGVSLYLNSRRSLLQLTLLSSMLCAIVQYNLPSGGSGSIMQRSGSGLQRTSSSVQRTGSSHPQKKRRGLMLGIFDAIRHVSPACAASGGSA